VLEMVLPSFQRKFADPLPDGSRPGEDGPDDRTGRNHSHESVRGETQYWRVAGEDSLERDHSRGNHRGSRRSGVAWCRPGSAKEETQGGEATRLS
jgi:hypothetical protein